MVRLLVMPLGYYAFRGQRAQARLAPQVQELYKRHSGQPERLQRELSALYAGEGAGMFTGCLPALLQIPFFTVVYRLFLSGTVGGSPNLLLHQHLLWRARSAATGSPGQARGAARGWCSPPCSPSSSWSPGSPPGRRGAGRADAQAQRRVARQQGHRRERGARVAAGILPFATVAFAAMVPLAAGLYLLTTTAWAAAERAVFHRLGPGRQRAAPKPPRSLKRSAGRPGPGV